MPAQAITLHICAALRQRASGCVDGQGQRGMVLALHDTTGVFADDLAAQWIGPEAAAFLDTHAAELVPGRCVDLELYHLKRGPNELRARIKSCQLAALPVSWVRHLEKTTQTNHQETHA